jgi:hypothetical protein
VHRLHQALFAACAILTAGCSTTVTVFVEAAQGVSLQSLAAEIKVASSGSDKVHGMPTKGGRVPLPGEFTLVLPDVTTAVTVTLSGVDAAGAALGATQTATSHAYSDTRLSFVLGSPTVTPTDGGISPFGEPADMLTEPADMLTGCGGPCATGNPGACAMGTLMCDGKGGSTCVPNVTSQSCYSGPVGTAGVGICRAGTQSCIGTLGACSGEVDPATHESCFNNLDDDCDGTINNGCPIGIATGTPRSLSARGGTGGSPFSLRCPANAYVTKTTVSVDSGAQWVSGVAISCATPTLVTGASSYSVTLTPLTPQPFGSALGSGTSGALGSDDCGTSAFNAGWYISGAAEPGGAGADGLDKLGMSCASGSLSFDSNTNQLTFSFTKQSASTVFSAFNGGTSFEDDCMSNEVLIGFDGRDGQWLDQLQAVCAPLTTVYK